MLYRVPWCGLTIQQWQPWVVIGVVLLIRVHTDHNVRYKWHLNLNTADLASTLIDMPKDVDATWTRLSHGHCQFFKNFPQWFLPYSCAVLGRLPLVFLTFYQQAWTLRLGCCIRYPCPSTVADQYIFLIINLVLVQCSKMHEVATLILYYIAPNWGICWWYLNNRRLSDCTIRSLLSSCVACRMDKCGLFLVLRYYSATDVPKCRTPRGIAAESPPFSSCGKAVPPT